MAVWRNQYIFIDSCSCRTLTQHKYRGQSMSTWLSCYATSVLLRNCAIWYTKDEVCSITWLQQQQLTQDPLSAGEVRCCKLPTAQARNYNKASGGCSWRHSFTEGKYSLPQTIFKQLHRAYWNNTCYSQTKRSTKLHVKNDMEVETSKQNNLEN